MRTRWFNKVLEDIIQTGQTFQGIEKEILWEDNRLEAFCFMHIQKQFWGIRRRKNIFTAIYHLS
jgi:hypothetical protein